jgi:hypothetical protein
MRQRLRSNDLIEAAPAVTNNRTPRTPSRRGSPDKVKAFTGSNLAKLPPTRLLESVGSSLSLGGRVQAKWQNPVSRA